MIDAVLFVRKLPAALGAHEGVVLATLVLEVPVEVVIPVVRSLKEKKLIFVRQTFPRVAVYTNTDYPESSRQ